MNVNYPKSSFIYQDVQFAWGIKGIDDTDTVLWDPDNFGSIIWDETFDPFTYESLTFLNEMCEALNDPRPDYVPEGERKDVMKCWIMDFIPYI